MESNNILEMIKCPYCSFSVTIIKNQENAVCDHCKQRFDIELWKRMYELPINKDTK